MFKKVLVSSKSKGFTLIELLVVIAIIGILATIIIINVTGARAKATEAKVSSEISEANKAVAMCKVNGGTVGSSVIGNPICPGDPSVTSTWPDISAGAGFSYGTCDPAVSATYSCTATNFTTNRQITYTSSGVGAMTSGGGGGLATCTFEPFSAQVGDTLIANCVGGGGVAYGWYLLNGASSSICGNSNTCVVPPSASGNGVAVEITNGDPSGNDWENIQ